MCVQGKYCVSQQGCLTFSGQNDRTCVLAGVFPEEVPLSMVLRSLPMKNTNLLTSVCFLPPILHAVWRGSKCMHSLSLLPPTLQMTGPHHMKVQVCMQCMQVVVGFHSVISHAGDRQRGWWYFKDYGRPYSLFGPVVHRDESLGPAWIP